MKTFNTHLRCALQVLAAALMPLTTACMAGAPEADNGRQLDGGAEILMDKNGATNVALGGTATQSSTTYNGSPARAIDGNTSGRWGENSVTHTAQTAAPWWRVDLGNAHRVDRVTLWNRTSCCSERLSNFHVDYLDAQGSVIVSQDYPGQAGTTTEIMLSASGVHAVRVQLYGTNPLSLAEVQVWGALESTTPNVALGATASQSSTTYRGDAARAIDGNTSGHYGESSVTHTASTVAPWWRVDLGKAHRVDRVSLWNRTDCCTTRLSNFHVDYLDAEGNVIVSQDYPGQAGVKTEIVLSARGVHAVRVQLYGTNPLSLAEVQVWGAPDAGSDDPDAGSDCQDGVIDDSEGGADIRPACTQPYPWPSGKVDNVGDKCFLCSASTAVPYDPFNPDPDEQNAWNMYASRAIGSPPTKCVNALFGANTFHRTSQQCSDFRATYGGVCCGREQACSYAAVRYTDSPDLSCDAAPTEGRCRCADDLTAPGRPEYKLNFLASEFSALSPFAQAVRSADLCGVEIGTSQFGTGQYETTCARLYEAARRGFTQKYECGVIKKKLRDKCGSLPITP